MIILGLTGSIGMGKSTAAKMLKIMGVPIHDSDHAVHKALAPGGEAFEEVAAAFPAAWDSKNRIIDRGKLGALIFADAEAKRKLEAILHPAAQRSQLDFIRAMERKGKAIVCLDIPLLFETGAEARMDYTICVTAPPAIQKRRVMKRPGMSAEKFDAIVQSQMPDAEKQARADYVVETGKGYSHAFFRLWKILKEIKKKG
ncbi:MAG: dephospho-CoA kinase [Micavibrio sp.]